MSSPTVARVAGRPRDERLDAAILDATLRLLERRGYHRLALTAVAEVAGTTTAASYRRWTSKSDLVMHAPTSQRDNVRMRRNIHERLLTDETDSSTRSERCEARRH